MAVIRPTLSAFGCGPSRRSVVIDGATVSNLFIMGHVNVRGDRNPPIPKITVATR